MTETFTGQSEETVTALQDLAERFQLITAKAVFQLRHELFESDADAESVLRQMAAARILHETTLYGYVSCFVPAAIPTNRPLSEITRIRALAMLNVCASGSRVRRRLNAVEFKKYFPTLHRPGLPMNYYIDLSEEQATLGFLRVDTGGCGRWDRIVAKAMGDVRKHHLEPAFAPFIKRGALEIRVVTALQQKANRISRLLSEKPTILTQSIQVSVVPEILNLIAPVSV